MISKVGEIASSKHIVLKAGDESLKGGSYELLDESSHNGVMNIKFRTLY